MSDHSHPADLLVCGGLTIDRFADGTSAAGGSVIHASLAVVRDRLRQATLTVAGDEPEALGGLARLESLGPVIIERATGTTTYRHGERDGRRVLAYEGGAAPIGPGTVARAPAARVALVAPIADEVPGETLDALRKLRPATTVLLLQGWLRSLVPGAEVAPLPLVDVPLALWRAFEGADAVVLSTEDLGDSPADPFAQVADLRARLGRRPVIVLTLGTEGWILDDPSRERVVASVPRTVVAGVPTVGAGDTFGAAFAVRLGQGDDPLAAATGAAERVIETLEARRS